MPSPRQYGRERVPDKASRMDEFVSGLSGPERVRRDRGTGYAGERTIMNLEFQYVKDVPLANTIFALERADITRCGDFWRVWRSPAVEELKQRKIYINNEDGRWYAYRLRSKDPEKQLWGDFNLRYQVKDMSNLLPYQPVAVSHLVQSLIDNGAAADGSDTGLGKTYLALAVCRETCLRPIVVCRISGITVWARVSSYMGVKPLLITNWESIRTAKPVIDGKPVITRKRRKILDTEINKYDYAWNTPRGSLLIFDEAHLAFNPDSQNYGVWASSNGRASLSMSATFADRPSRLEGLFRVLKIMEPEAFKAWLIERGHFVNQYDVVESLTALSDMKWINKVLYPKYGYRLAYDDPEVKKFFPERVIQTEVVDLGAKIVAEQNAAYADLLKKAEEYRLKGKQADLLVADLRYRQHAELLKAPLLVDMAKEYLYQRKAVLIFVNFRETLKYLAEALHTRSLIFGDQERYGLSRDTVVDNFQSGAERIVLAMTNAGGQSISLHDLRGDAQRISLICPTYDPIMLQQVLGRAYRAGAKSPPICKLVYAAGTIEEKVADIVNRKLDNIAALNNGDLMEPDLFQLGLKRAA